MPENVSRTLEHLPLTGFKPAPRNARTHSKKQIQQIKGAIERWGFTNPVLIDQDGTIIAGHGRVAAARALGLTEAPCLRISGLSDLEKEALAIADNKLALNAGWDMEVLSSQLQSFIELEFDVTLTGFELPEIDLVLTEASEASAQQAGPEDEHPARPAAAETVTRQGDVWLLGAHRLICGDAKDPAVVAKLMGGGTADAVFTDPPYNVPIDGHVSGLGGVRHREFAEASGEMSSEAFTEFLTQSLGAAADVCRDGAIAFVCMDWRHLPEVSAAGHRVFRALKNICVWSKTNAGMGTFYRSQHEMVLVWKVGDGPHTNTFGLGDKGRYRTNVWSYPGVNTFKAERMEELASHPTVKPVALVADAIRDVTHRGDTVLDVFGGSGTTLIAAQKTGRRARLVEIDPAYCDVIVRRWQKMSGKQASHATAWKTFDDIQEQRLGERQLTNEVAQ